MRSYVLIIVLFFFLLESNSIQAITVTPDTLQFGFEYSQNTPGVVFATFGAKTVVNAHLLNNTTEDITLELLGNDLLPTNYTVADFVVTNGQSANGDWVLENGYAHWGGFSPYSFSIPIPFAVSTLRQQIGPYVTLHPGEKFIYPWMFIDTTPLATGDPSIDNYMRLEPTTGNPFDIVASHNGLIGTGIVPDANGNFINSINYYSTQNIEIRFNAVAPVPLPAAFWLFGSGLVGLFGYVRRRSNKIKD